MRFRGLFGQRRWLFWDLTPEQKREAFEKRVRRSRVLHLWKPGDPIVFGDSGTRLLVGIATSSNYELDLLDEIEGQLTHLKADTWLRVDVFRFDEFQDSSEFTDWIPVPVHFTVGPVAALWIDQAFDRVEYGYRANLLVRDQLNECVNHTKRVANPSG